jgi:hypothetical protein
MEHVDRIKFLAGNPSLEILRLSDDISNRICLIAEPAAFCMQVCEIFSKGENF